MLIRQYSREDFLLLRQLYEESGWFDPETDAEERLKAKVEKDPQSLLVAIDNNQIVGTLSLVEDGRIALFFRVVTKDREDVLQIRAMLLSKGEAILKLRGYNEVHIIAPEQDQIRQKEYAQYGFQKGNSYRWMWKKI